MIHFQNKKPRKSFLLKKWKGYMSCSHLELFGVLKPNRGRKCTSFTSDPIYKSINSIKCTNTHQIIAINQRLSCMPQNLVHMSHCMTCNMQHFGKVSAGSTNRSMMRRHNKHINDQRQLWRSLLSLGFIAQETGLTLLMYKKGQKIFKSDKDGNKEKTVSQKVIPLLFIKHLLLNLKVTILK